MRRLELLAFCTALCAAAAGAQDPDFSKVEIKTEKLSATAPTPCSWSTISSRR
jgi:hypothetical protein